MPVEIGQTKQGPTESVQSYNLRFRQTLNELVYAVQNKHFEPTRRRIAIEEEEDEATRTYVLNLRKEIGILVIPSQPRTLMEAQIRASEIELWARDANRSNERKTNFNRPQTRPIIKSIDSPQQNPRKPFNYDMPLADRFKIKCFKCDKLGHTANNCYARNFQIPQQGKLPPRVNTTTEDLPSESTVPETSTSEYVADSPEWSEWGPCSSTQEQESTYSYEE